MKCPTCQEENTAGTAACRRCGGMLQAPGAVPRPAMARIAFPTLGAPAALPPSLPARAATPARLPSVPAAPPAAAAGPSVFVEIEGNSATFPETCACCGAAAPDSATLTASHTVNHDTTNFAWGIPYCAPCAAHVRGSGWTEVIAIGITIVVALVVSAMFLAGGNATSGGALMTMIAGYATYPGMVIGTRRWMVRTCPACVGADLSVAVPFNDGRTFRFRFRRPEFGLRFAALNQRQPLAGDPDAASAKSPLPAMLGLSAASLGCAAIAMAVMFMDAPDQIRIHVIVWALIQVIGWTPTMFIAGGILWGMAAAFLRAAWEKWEEST